MKKPYDTVYRLDHPEEQCKGGNEGEKRITGILYFFKEDFCNQNKYDKIGRKFIRSCREKNEFVPDLPKLDVRMLVDSKKWLFKSLCQKVVMLTTDEFCDMMRDHPELRISGRRMPDNQTIMDTVLRKTGSMKEMDRA